jgi:small subunit ribosomal protein S30e
MDELVLSFNGTPLNDEQTVEQFGLVSGSTLDATVKLFGGKVHGSLARAGKVKGQTPKVKLIIYSLEKKINISFFF